MRLTKLSFFASIGLAGLVGCAGSSNPNIEVISIEQQAVEAVDSHQPWAVVALADDTDAWTRARYFMAKYTAPEPELSTNALASNPSTRDRFHYVIKRNKTHDGIMYTVTCKPINGNADQFAADRNAKNVARWIKEGKLEGSVLKK